MIKNKRSAESTIQRWIECKDKNGLFFLSNSEFDSMIEECHLAEHIVERFAPKFYDLYEWAASFPHLDNAEEVTQRAQKYVSDHLRERLYLAVQKLFIESIAVGLNEPVHSAVIDKLDKRIAAQGRASAPELKLSGGKGGARRKPATHLDEERCEDYACLVDELHPLWEYILDFFREGDYEHECITDVQGREKFKTLSRDRRVPLDLIKAVTKKKASKDAKYSPLGFALEHARRNLRFPDQYKFKYETLKKIYDSGKRSIVAREKEKGVRYLQKV